MHTKLPGCLAIVAMSLLLGCEAHPVESLPQSAAPDASLATPPGAVAAPFKDVSLPTVGAASSRTDEGPSGTTTASTLTRKELDAQMPLPGQVNDYSTPAPAKKGDSKASAPTTK